MSDRPYARTCARTYVRTYARTLRTHARTGFRSFSQANLNYVLGVFGRAKIVPHEARGTFFCTTKRTERPKGTTERQNVRPRDRNMYDRTDMWMCGRTTERVTCNRLKTHIEYFLFGKTCCERWISSFWLDIQWRNPRSQQQFVLNVGYPIARLFTKACVWHHKRSGLSHFHPN